MGAHGFTPGRTPSAVPLVAGSPYLPDLSGRPPPGPKGEPPPYPDWILSPDKSRTLGGVFVCRLLAAPSGVALRAGDLVGYVWMADAKVLGIDLPPGYAPGAMELLIGPLVPEGITPPPGAGLPDLPLVPIALPGISSAQEAQAAQRCYDEGYHQGSANQPRRAVTPDLVLSPAVAQACYDAGWVDGRMGQPRRFFALPGVPPYGPPGGPYPGRPPRRRRNRIDWGALGAFASAFLGGGQAPQRPGFPPGPAPQWNLDPRIGYELYAVGPRGGVPFDTVSDGRQVAPGVYLYLLGGDPGDEHRGFRLSGPGGVAVQLGQPLTGGRGPQALGLPAFVAVQTTQGPRLLTVAEFGALVHVG